ncbi:Redox-sensing transcriptional repressor Rex [Allorhodopirellula heiligendammensis]|uniref:Redox-sensing transcriptional repressor Rex n=2 Tax=Allorhodopirellula heiligendammensis TaxID=2714739 RepID=A0A5C6BFZ3_9BACT|nr:Redox-sensing transcriptional repressor Rex [Allorhodopirellula heiligendammensis]
MGSRLCKRAVRSGFTDYPFFDPILDMPPSMNPPISAGHPDGAGSNEIVRTDLSTPAVGRLSLYFRELHRLLDAGQTSTNSRDLAAMVNVSAAVVRRDLSSIGSVGRRGVGYDVASLADHIGVVLGSGVHWKAVMIGVGFLGNALLRYRGFERLGFSLAAAFDTDPTKIGGVVGNTKILPMDQLEPVLRELKPELAILAVPSEQAKEVAAQVVALGIQGILNFAPTTLRVSSAVAVINVDLASELQQLAFRIQNA